MERVLATHEADSVEMRAAYCGALMEAAKKDARIVAINCDLCSSMGLKDFTRMFPERSVNVGIQEANGCSMAGGMAAAGLIPFFHTFSVFATRRVYDQIFMSCAYPKLNAKLIGGDAGVSATTNGGTHMAFEDIGIMRVMPDVTVMEPSDAVMMRSLVRQMADTYGVQYLRFPRKQSPKIYKEGAEFTIGRGVVLREGTDASIITNGLLTAESLKAADMLAALGVSVRVVDMFTVKPIDRELVMECAGKTEAIVTAENHQITGGLGSAVAEVLAEKAPVPMERVGVKGVFGEVGPQDYLMDRFQLTAPYIVKAVQRVIERKRH